MEVDASDEGVDANEGLCDPEVTDPEDAMYCSGPPQFLGGEEDCIDEMEDAITAGNAAVGAGVIAIVTGGTSNPIGLIATGGFVFQTGIYGGKLLDYGMCRLGLLQLAVNHVGPPFPSSHIAPVAAD